MQIVHVLLFTLLWPISMELRFWIFWLDNVCRMKLLSLKRARLLILISSSFTKDHWNIDGYYILNPTPSAGTYKMWLSRWGFAWSSNNTRIGLLVYFDPFCGGDIENNRNSNILYASSLRKVVVSCIAFSCLLVAKKVFTTVSYTQWLNNKISDTW